MSALSEALGYAGGVGLAGGLLGQLGDALSAPRRYAWSALGLPESGAELVSNLTGLDQDSWLAHGLGFGAELVGDPLTYAGGLLGGLSKTRAGKAAIGETGAILGDLANDTKSVWREALDDTPAVVMGQRQPRRGILQLPELDNRLEPPRVTPPLNMLPDIRADAAESASRAADLVPVQNQVWDDYLRSLKVGDRSILDMFESDGGWFRLMGDGLREEALRPEWGELFKGITPDDMIEMAHRVRENANRSAIADLLGDAAWRNVIYPRNSVPASVSDEVLAAVAQLRDSKTQYVHPIIEGALHVRARNNDLLGLASSVSADEAHRLRGLQDAFYKTLPEQPPTSAKELRGLWSEMLPRDLVDFELSGNMPPRAAKIMNSGISRMLDDAASQGYVLPYQSVHTLLESNPWFLARPFTSRRGARLGNRGLA